jgi:hypothetical protein
MFFTSTDTVGKCCWNVICNHLYSAHDKLGLISVELGLISIAFATIPNAKRIFYHSSSTWSMIIKNLINNFNTFPLKWKQLPPIIKDFSGQLKFLFCRATFLIYSGHYPFNWSQHWQQNINLHPLKQARWYYCFLHNYRILSHFFKEV